MCAPDRRRSSTQRGFSLIELMIGLLVALAVGLAATSAAISFTAQARQGIGTGLAVTGNANTLTAVKADVAQAGLGFFGDTAYTCTQLAVSAGTRDLSLTGFAPLQATYGTTDDTLQVLAASDVAGGAGVVANGVSGLASATLASYLPVSVGQAVLLAPAPGTGTTCTVRSVSAVKPPAAGSPAALNFDAGQVHNDLAFATPASYVTGDRVALLGTLRWSRYSLSGGKLLLEQPLSGKPAATLLSNVMTFRVQYGVAADGGTSVSNWTAPQGEWATITPANIARLRAVRLGLVTRSPQREKPDASGVCHASDDNTKPKLFGNAVTLPADWQCWRYRSDEVIVPLRNFIVGLQ